MFKTILSFCCVLLIFSCNDGDVFITSLDFSNTLEYCEGNDDIIVYTVKDTPPESLSARLPIADLTNFTTVGEFSSALSTSYTFNHRSYTGDPSAIFCNSLPPSSPEIITDSEATNGTVQFYTTLIEDDNDGILASLEDANIDNDNDPSTNPTDTDGDGIPNYLDSDDDGDNIPTIQEDADQNDDGDISDALDSDADGIPNYLDNDDDNDGIITRYEDTNGDGNPTNDITDAAIGPDYLNNNITESTVYDQYNSHNKSQVFTCIIEIEDMVLVNANNNTIMISDTYTFGTITTTNSSIDYDVPFD